MSAGVVQQEIGRFLSTGRPEVLCISGKWGVGKTYSWQKFVREIEAAGKLAWPRYAYVSLFGLNSLSDLKNAIVENTIVASGPLTSPDASTLHAVLRGGERFARQSRPMLDIASGFFRMRDAGDALYRAAFLTVRNQLICFDDVERAGKALEMRDLLGLASMLREQRGCKIAILLNKERADDDQADELERQLEKVIDTFLVFEPTSAEAVQIAVESSDEIAEILKKRIIALGITNMRVIRKIERWVRVLSQVLDFNNEIIREQSISTATLAGWSFLQKDSAPSLGYIEKFNSFRGMFGKDERPPVEMEWQSVVTAYGYTSTDDLDREIIAGIRLGYFDYANLKAAEAEKLAQQDREAKGGKFSAAWRLYHDTLDLPDEVILDAMYEGAREDLSFITPLNMNSAVRFLREHGREEQASELVRLYVEAHRTDGDFFRRWDRFFGNDPTDAEFIGAMEAGRAAIVDARDPAQMLKAMARSSGFNPAEDSALLSKLTADELVELFDSNSGEELKGMVEWAHRLSRQPGADLLKERFDEAVAKIAARSPMRASKLRSWGVFPETEE